MDTTDLPSGHFWDSEEAEKEYYEVGRRIKEAEQRARAAAIRYHCEFILALIFRRAYCRAQHKKSFDDPDYYRDLHSPGLPSVEPFQWLIDKFHDEIWKKYNDEGKMEKKLYYPLNPWWMPPDGWFSSEWAGSPLSSVSRQIGDSLTLCESKTEPVETYYAYKISFGGFREKLVKYVTFRRFEWYTLTDEAAMSNLEWVLWYGQYLPPKINTKVAPPFPETFTQPPFDAEEDVKAASALALSRRDELIGEVRSFLSPYRKWRFVPWIPPEVREARLVPDLPEGLPEREEGYYPKPSGSPTVRQLPKTGKAPVVPDLPEGDSVLETVPGSPLPPLKIGQRWADPYWIGHGQWGVRRVPGAEEWLLRLERRFHDRIVAAMQKAYEPRDEWAQLCRQQKAIRIVHYKPEAYKVFWSVLQTAEE